MANFIKPQIKTAFITVVGYVKNNPVNIELCTELISDDEYDGYGKKNPIIRFKGGDAKWYFDQDDYKARDSEYERILKLFSKE